MDRANVDANDREAQVNLAIYDFHAALDRGEPVERAQWAAQRPEIAVELNAYFDDLAALELARPNAPAEAHAITTALIPAAQGVRESESKAHDCSAGDALGDYILLEQLGEGGQGVVWKACPRKSPEIVVAIKTLRGPATRDLASVARLRQDAEAIARMKHENIIQTYFVGEDHGRWFFVTELMEGGTLSGRLESYKEDPRSAAVLIEKIARAVHHAHTRNPGVLHLDLKPDNILLTSRGEPKVSDFGLSMQVRIPEQESQQQAFEGTSDESAARSAIVGTVPFMSPEMAAGRWQDVSTGSDIYGLGAVLYAMLTGRAPFRGANLAETLALLSKGQAKSPRELNRKVDRELTAICAKCLERDPKLRYGSADALANDIRRWLERRPTLARFEAIRHPRAKLLGAAAPLARRPGVRCRFCCLDGQPRSLSQESTGRERSRGRTAGKPDQSRAELDRARHTDDGE